MGAEVPADARPALRLLPVLAGAPDDAVAAIQAAMSPERVAEGDALLVEGDAGDRLYVLVEGRLEVFRRVPAAAGLRLATLLPGALVGTGAFLLGTPRNASCVAACDAWIDSDGRLRRATWAAAYARRPRWPLNPPATSSWRSVEFWDLGVPVAIEIPEFERPRRGAWIVDLAAFSWELRRRRNAYRRNQPPTSGRG